MTAYSAVQAKRRRPEAEEIDRAQAVNSGSKTRFQKEPRLGIDVPDSALPGSARLSALDEVLKLDPHPIILFLHQRRLQYIDCRRNAQGWQVVSQFELRPSEGRRSAALGAAASLTAARLSLRHSRSGSGGWGRRERRQAAPDFKLIHYRRAV
jgi:hypothetical protein